MIPENSKKGGDQPPGERRPASGGVRGDWIGKQLRSAYDSTLSEPLPANLQDLVGKIMKQTQPDPNKAPERTEDKIRDR